MTSRRQSHPPSGAAIGLAAGMFVGASLVIWFAPRLTSKLRQRFTDSTNRVGRRASNHYEQASNRFGEAVEALTIPRAL